MLAGCAATLGAADALRNSLTQWRQAYVPGALVRGDGETGSPTREVSGASRKSRVRSGRAAEGDGKTKVLSSETTQVRSVFPTKPCLWGM